ncbi:hypothetical protein V1525DRAFT_394713 [Lipomyces kononenkoae]|uniref:Uncharacterized protein n=1 Tax=Lipomyces kononenkoae TaxID=34357 RepID=A0ACC3T9T1_LIPKO
MVAALPQKSVSVPDSYVCSPSIAFPFPVSEDISALDGPTYVVPQTLVELSNYAVADAIFTYSPETFDLDNGLALWNAAEQANGFGVVPFLSRLETRAGAGSLPLGYILSSNLQRKFHQAPRAILASSGSLPAFAPILNEISYLSALPSPITFSVAAIDYSPVSGAYVPDYVTAFTTARESGLALVTSSRVSELQHMSLYASLLATVMPSFHLYDGLRLSRESQRVVDVLGVNRTRDIFERVLASLDGNFHRTDSISRASKILTSLNAELGTSYRPFEYDGHDQPDVVLVILGSCEAAIATDVALRLSDAGERVGVLTVRVAAPFGDSQFLNALPRSTKQVLVFGQVYRQQDVEDPGVQSALYSDVFAAVIMSSTFPVGARPKLVDFKYTREQAFTPNNFVWIYEQVLKGVPAVAAIPDSLLANSFSSVASFNLLHGQDVSQFVFWSPDDSVLAYAPAKLAQLFSLDSNRNTGFISTFDNQTLAGIVQSELRSSKRAIDASISVTNANVVVVNDDNIFSNYNVVASLRHGGTLLINTTSNVEALGKKVPADIKKLLISKAIVVYTINLSEAVDGDDKTLASVAAQLAFLSVAAPAESVETYLGKLACLNYLGDDKHVAKISEISEKVQSLLTKLEGATWDLNVEEEQIALPVFPVSDSFTPNEEKFINEPEPELDSWQTAAKHLAFKEAYDYKSELRPDLPVKNFVAKVQELKRLTPLSYDRNIFHIEFDITGTGLKYEIGEALGIHGQNDKELVEQFIRSYGLDGEGLVLVPSRDDSERFEYRTVFQVLLEDLDIFGKTPKKFYESLAEYAKDEKQKAHLLKIASAEGTEEFKKRGDDDTLTYADVLQEFDSAHPPFEDLIKIVNPLKRREYSIASSQKVHPNAVHLLIVVVDWVDSKGRKRYGQCSRYISQLKIGSEVVVSVKPSVMKLPPSPKQPIIMSGLGTGLAPFKAFVEEKAYQKSQGKDIGDIFLYLGSRHQKEEYLYGEFWEAHMAAGIVTHIGAAFSRDQPQKIYIQDRMRESIDKLVPAYVQQEGVFYLCGPTWPVPDVTAVLEDVIAKDAEIRGVKVDTAKEVEELKEKNRYILEVY